MPEFIENPEREFQERKERTLQDLREATRELIFEENAAMQAYRAEILIHRRDEEQTIGLFTKWYTEGESEIDRNSGHENVSKKQLGLALMKTIMLLEIERLDDFCEDAYTAYQYAVQLGYNELAQLLLRLSGEF